MLTKPQLLRRTPIDVSSGGVFRFEVVGGNQVVANSLIIRDNETNNIVYNQRVESFKLEHNLTPNAPNMSNGKYWNAEIITYDKNNNSSSPSNKIAFYTFTEPKLEFIDFDNNVQIESSKNTFKVKYVQIEGELLDSYNFILYNVDGYKISESGTQYANGKSELEYTFTGFDDGSSFSVEVIGITEYGTRVTTGKYVFHVRYIKPNVFAVLDLENNCQGGYINIKSNIVLIEGESNPDPPIFIDDKEVDLTDPTHWVKWCEGYVVNDNFLFKMWLRKLNQNCTFNVMFDKENNNEVTPYKIELKSVNRMRYDYPAGKRDCIEVYVYSELDVPYFIASDYFELKDDVQYFICVKRIDNIYQLIVKEVV